MEIAKALILASDRRTGWAWPSSRNEPRHLFPVANRPILFHNLEALHAAGVLEATIFCDGRMADATRSAVGDGRRWGMSVHYEGWEPEAGVRGALAAGRDFLRGEPALVQPGDVLLRERLHGHISAFAREGLDALALRPSRPSAGPILAASPWYLLSPRGISVLEDEHDAGVNPVVGIEAQGGRVRVQLVDGCAPCQGDADALLEGNRRVLEGLTTSVDPGSVQDCTIQGAVEVHPTARIARTLLRGPAIIGPGAEISDAYIGPYTSIGAGVKIEGSEIEHAIVLADAEVRFVATRLESSVIGRGARIVREFKVPHSIRLSIGDGAEVVLT
jgi:glucose-1-phosphate thymidylyltransferase